MAKSTMPVPPELLRRSAAAFHGARAALDSPAFVSPLPGLHLLRHPGRTAFEATVYEPVLCLIQLIRHDSHASAVARAIANIRSNFREPLAVPELAQRVGMSVASFHRQFKAVTASSPLQYQKELRLLEARRILRSGTASVQTAAFEVGYESPNHFSREYARRFGRPPKDDLPKATGRIQESIPA